MNPYGSFRKSSIELLVGVITEYCMTYPRTYVFPEIISVEAVWTNKKEIP